MGDVAIRVEGLGKRYKIGHLQKRHDTLRDQIADLRFKFFDLGKRSNGHHAQVEGSSLPSADTIWALKDVSFEVQRGEVVGIIGRNGAGKSTLLKILSRITEPTEGAVDIYGRVGSLLEVGTGFHPELTGRENIYLNGAILGMRKAEIEKKFDEIVAFAEVERFIDTPVKHYSSGMYVRLAFAVAAHLEPEILLVDEVLAVGDAAFQKKCLGKMGDVAREGRTVLFVSHNMAAVSQLCRNGLLLVEGSLGYEGPVEHCIAEYVADNAATSNMWLRKAQADNPLLIEAVSAELGQKAQNLIVKIALSSKAEHKPAFLAIDVLDAAGTTVMQALPTIEPFIFSKKINHKVEININLPPLIPGQYLLTVWAGSHNTETLDQVERCVSFHIIESPTPGRSFPHDREHGWIVPDAKLTYLPRELQN